MTETLAAPVMPKEFGGRPEPRQEARSKVTGQPLYAADFPVENLAYGYLVMSSIARGRMRWMKLDAARAVPGVLDILTHQTVEPIPGLDAFMSGGQGVTALPPLQDDRIYHSGQIVALVVAETYEAAREAGYLIEIDYEEERPTASFDGPGAEYLRQDAVRPDHEDAQAGDVEGGLAAAAAVVDRRYSTAVQHHNPIELHSTTAIWEGDELTIHEPSQYYYAVREAASIQMKVPREKVRVRAPFVGGAFGCKGMVTQRTAIAALAARRLGRPVRVVATRPQGFTMATHRSETRHRVRLGADAAGKLTGYHHDMWEVTSRTDIYANGGVEGAACLYGPENIGSTAWVVRADRATPGFMRNPHGVPVVFALESAMDELAHELRIDPVEMRKRNNIVANPISGIPFTSRSLNECLDAGAERFGWSQRTPEPGSMRDGDWLVGWGCASCFYPLHMFSNAGDLTLSADGRIVYDSAVSDVGQGAATIIAQVVAERLGVPAKAVEMRSGDTAYPPGVHAGASMTTASATNTAIKAAEQMLARLGQPKPNSGEDQGVQRLLDGLARLGLDQVKEHAEWSPPGAKTDALSDMYKAKGVLDMSEVKTGSHRSFSWGSNFVEVRVHSRTREIRVPRMIGAFAGGYIINPRTTRSQLMGTMIWGLGGALLEATQLDEKRARYVNSDLAEYEIAANADVQEVDVIIVPEKNDDINAMNVKGLGELANAGTAAAIATAVWHATGKRIYDLPINLDKLFVD